MVAAINGKVSLANEWTVITTAQCPIQMGVKRWNIHKIMARHICASSAQYHFEACLKVTKFDI